MFVYISPNHVHVHVFDASTIIMDISFSVLIQKIVITGFVMFVLTLNKEYYLTQFSLVRIAICIMFALCIKCCCSYILFSFQFGWTHLTMFLLGTQIYFVMQNVFEGLFWFLVPVSMVVCNDIMAYVFGEVIQ